MSGTFQTYTVLSASSFNPAPGLNVSSDTPASTLQAEAGALGVSSVRATVTTAAEEATLASLGSAGIHLDLVLAPGQSVASLVSFATQINAAAPGSLVALEGPDLVANPGYTYLEPASNATLSGDAAGDQATADLAQAAAGAGLGGVATINYSTAVATTATSAVANPTDLNINPGAAPLQEPDFSALGTAQDNATTALNANATTVQYAVTELGSTSGAELLDALLDAEYVVGLTQTDTGSLVVPSVYLAAATAGAAALFNADNSLTSVGSAYANLDAILAGGRSGSSAGGTLQLSVAPYQAGVQYDQNVEVFAGPGSTDDIVWWGNSEAPYAFGHGPSLLSFGSVEASVSVFDPSQGTAAIATYSNISALEVLNSPDGPLVVQVSNTLGSGASATGTYAGVVSTGVATSATGSGTSFVTAPSGANAVTASATGNDVITSQGTDTITAGGGSDTVYASGPAATVNGGTGTLVFIAGAGNYTAGGGSGINILYAGTGTDALIGSSGTNSILVAGSGNISLVGGLGNAAVMFGGSGANTFFGSTGGNDTMVGGTGSNLFISTQGDVLFGGPGTADTFDLSGGEIVVEGAGANTVNFDAGASTVFGGGGATTYNLLAGVGDNSAVIGFTAADHLTLAGVSGTAEAAAVASATTGSFGTMLSLADGTRIVLFGATLNASQVSAG